ncbi:extensin-like [Gouania willdenowi]|uniref:extensin-like n=1 Tax=Gouania willdenowi TaxID=441366 RepID=UPI0010553486|nr:extensin-like [Gouania willdenowi]
MHSLEVAEPHGARGTPTPRHSGSPARLVQGGLPHRNRERLRSRETHTRTSTGPHGPTIPQASPTPAPPPHTNASSIVPPPTEATPDHPRTDTRHPPIPVQPGGQRAQGHQPHPAQGSTVPHQTVASYQADGRRPLSERPNPKTHP